jgi:hypothetical protein
MIYNRGESCLRRQSRGMTVQIPHTLYPPLPTAPLLTPTASSQKKQHPQAAEHNQFGQLADQVKVGFILGAQQQDEGGK